MLPIAGDLRWRDVDAGYDHACGITTEGELACWGILGRVLPGASTEVGGALRFTQLASGVDFTCALDAQGAAWCAGIDDWGQLGRGTTHSIFDTQGLAPVSSTLRFASLYAGDRYACGLTADGAAWCWGDRSRGTGRALVPVEFSRLERVTTFAAGPRGACGVTAAGAVRCAPVFVRPGA